MCRWGRTISFKTLISLAHAKLGGESWAVIHILTHSNRSGELRDTSAALSGRIDLSGSWAAWRAAPKASFRLCWEPSMHTDCCRALCCCLKPTGSQSGGVRHAVLHQCPKSSESCTTQHQEGHESGRRSRHTRRGQHAAHLLVLLLLQGWVLGLMQQDSSWEHLLAATSTTMSRLGFLLLLFHCAFFRLPLFPFSPLLLLV